MKKNWILTAATALTIAALPGVSLAGPGNKGGAGKGEGGKGAGKRDMQAALEQFDTDGDGKLSPKERVPMLKKRLAERPEMAAKLKEKFDADGDGTLSDAELTKAAAAMGKKRGSRGDGSNPKAGKRPGKGKGEKGGKKPGGKQ